MEIYRCAAAIPEQSCQLRFADVHDHYRLPSFRQPAGWNRTVCLCIVMVLGCSVATVISIFGVRYDRSPEMASKSVLQSNLLLPVTMPLMMFIAERIL